MAARWQIVLAEGGTEHKNAHIMREWAEPLHIGILQKKKKKESHEK